MIYLITATAVIVFVYLGIWASRSAKRNLETPKSWERVSPRDDKE